MMMIKPVLTGYHFNVGTTPSRLWNLAKYLEAAASEILTPINLINIDPIDTYKTLRGNIPVEFSKFVDAIAPTFKAESLQDGDLERIKALDPFDEKSLISENLRTLVSLFSWMFIRGGPSSDETATYVELMILHSKNAAALKTIAEAKQIAYLNGLTRTLLFNKKCFKENSVGEDTISAVMDRLADAYGICNDTPLHGKDYLEGKVAMITKSEPLLNKSTEFSSSVGEMRLQNKTYADVMVAADQRKAALRRAREQFEEKLNLGSRWADCLADPSSDEEPEEILASERLCKAAEVLKRHAQKTLTTEYSALPTGLEKLPRVCQYFDLAINLSKGKKHLDPKQSLDIKNLPCADFWSVDSSVLEKLNLPADKNDSKDLFTIENYLRTMLEIPSANDYRNTTQLGHLGYSYAINFLVTLYQESRYNVRQATCRRLLAPIGMDRSTLSSLFMVYFGRWGEGLLISSELYLKRLVRTTVKRFVDGDSDVEDLIKRLELLSKITLGSPGVLFKNRIRIVKSNVKVLDTTAKKPGVYKLETKTSYLAPLLSIADVPLTVKEQTVARSVNREIARAPAVLEHLIKSSTTTFDFTSIDAKVVAYVNDLYQITDVANGISKRRRSEVRGDVIANSLSYRQRVKDSKDGKAAISPSEWGLAQDRFVASLGDETTNYLRTLKEVLGITPENSTSWRLEALKDRFLSAMQAADAQKTSEADEPTSE